MDVSASRHWQRNIAIKRCIWFFLTLDQCVDVQVKLLLTAQNKHTMQLSHYPVAVLLPLHCAFTLLLLLRGTETQRVRQTGTEIGVLNVYLY